MKKTMAVLAIGVLFSLWLCPIASFASEIRGGLKAGLNVASFHGADVSFEFFFDMPAKSKLGPVGGGFITFNLSTNLAIQAEALYSVKGAKASAPADFEISATLGYLEIPILVKIMIPTQASVKPCLFVGPALAVNLSHKYKQVDNGVPSEGDLEGIKSTDLGAVFGAGLDIGRNIRTDLRYALGFAKIFQFEGQTYDVKNGAFSLMIGYCF